MYRSLGTRILISHVKKEIIALMRCQNMGTTSQTQRGGVKCPLLLAIIFFRTF